MKKEQFPSMLLTGSRGGSVADLLRRLIPADLILVSSDSAVPRSITLKVLCPEDTDEFRKLLREGSGHDETLLAVVPEGIEAEFQAGNEAVVLRESDLVPRTVAEVLKCSAGGMLKVSCTREVLWKLTGSLLPFFIHNLNNILARIMGNTELASLMTDKPEMVSTKLNEALNGVNDLRLFLQQLSDQSLPGDDSRWVPDELQRTGELGRMFSGRSVEFEVSVEDGSHAPLPVSRADLNAVLGLGAATAAMFTNGCGAIDVKYSSPGSAAVFRISWESQARQSEMLRENLEAASILTGTAACMCLRLGMGMEMMAPENGKGGVSFFVSPARGTS